MTDQAEQSEIIESDDVKQPEVDTPEGTAPDGVVEKEKQEEPAKKTFTQEEVDALIQKRLLKEERRVHRRIEQQLREQQQQRAAAEEPRRESFRDDDAYAQALLDSKAERIAQQKIAERQQAEEAAAEAERLQEMADEAAERYPDFHTVISNPSLPINADMTKFIVQSEIGADVAYYLGKNPAKAAQIAQMPTIKAARELIRIEAELIARPKATPSKAPEPISPVGTRGKASSSSLPSDDDDIETWMRKEQARLRSRH